MRFTVFSHSLEYLLIDNKACTITQSMRVTAGNQLMTPFVWHEHGAPGANMLLA